LNCSRPFWPDAEIGVHDPTRTSAKILWNRIADNGQQKFPTLKGCGKRGNESCIFAGFSLYNGLRTRGAAAVEGASRPHYLTKISRKLAQRGLAAPGSRARASPTPVGCECAPMTTVTSTFNVSSGQPDTGDTILSGGTEIVLSGGVANLTTVSSGGIELRRPANTVNSRTVYL
jgi:autotransporter passenger strand-loop-strand repeat protein